MTADAATPPRHPWFKFFPSDWKGDELLAMCSLSARGFLIECLCVMHRATPQGYLLVNGKPPTDAELARLVRASSVGEIRKVKAELLERGVLSLAGETLYSRRMVRTAKQSAVGHDTGKLGGNPQLIGRPLTPPVNGSPTNGLRVVPNPQIPEARNYTQKEVATDSETQRIASDFIEQYPAVYAKCRNGARYSVSRMNMERDYAYALDLARGWPDLNRLLSMAEVFLLSPHFGQKNVPGSPGQFLHLAPEVDAAMRKAGAR